MNNLSLLLDKIEKDIEVASMLNLFQLGIALKVLEDRSYGIDDSVACRCKELQHKIFKED